MKLKIASPSWVLLFSAVSLFAADGNRLTYLDENNPFYVGLNFPKLTTPQWVGEQGVETVVTLGIDDMGADHTPYERFLRSIIERLKKIDGRGPVSIFCNNVKPMEPHLQEWLKEGLSFEVHTMKHPCPILAKNDFQSAFTNLHDCVDLLNHVPGNRPVAFRTPCCDSINSPSPRLYAEIFNRTNSAGQFLTMDSSVMHAFTTNDSTLPQNLLLDSDGRPKFNKYLPFPSFSTTIENYPYPFIIGKLCWEFPAMVPSDWEAQHLHGNTNPVTLVDWQTAIDATVLKQGNFNLIFHPARWSNPEQIVGIIEHAVQKHGRKVKFLNFREAHERLTENLLAGQPLRAANGQDNGVRLIDLNNDGYLDVIIGNEKLRQTRLWNPAVRKWEVLDFPVSLVEVEDSGNRKESGVKFGIVHADGQATMIVRNEKVSSAWHFDGRKWSEEKPLLNGLEVKGQPLFTSRNGRDQGVRLRDVDNDGICELVVGNPSQNAVFRWSVQDKTWKATAFALPLRTSIVNAEGQDNGLRFVDVNEDGFADVIFSNEERFSFHLYVPEAYLGWNQGWTREVTSGARGETGELPMIVRAGINRNNGAWFKNRHLWVQNEDTASMPDLVDRRSFDKLLTGELPVPKSPADSLRCLRLPNDFKAELVAHEPLVQSPVAFEWGADGKLWVVETRDYPSGMDGKGQPGGVIKFLEDIDGDGRYDKATEFLAGIGFPTGVMPWRKGVLISAAPHILYAEDTDGDGKADIRNILFEGFNEGNPQHRVNGFEYGLDNWIYGANGDSGGNIRSLATGKTVSIAGRDFRFRPDDGAFEAEAGQTQFGRHRDDWGNWFGNNNGTWGYHFFLPEQYVVRNPRLAVNRSWNTFADYNDATRVFFISKPLQRFNMVGANFHVTSANSPTPYRDELFGPEYFGSIFISEPVYNLVHREILKPDGVSFSSRRAAEELQSEFLASTDTWFRPIMTKTGPDGALYIADMYRLVLEHPQWIPDDIKRRLDLRAGADKGRIYRVFPANTTLRKIPQFGQLDVAGLVAAIESPNGWQRDTVQRLLVERADTSAAEPLGLLARKSPRAQVRLQALCALDGLNALTPNLLSEALQDPHASVREHAIRLSETLLRGFTEGAELSERETALASALLKLVDDPEIRVRYQLAFTLGEWNSPRAGMALGQIALKDSSNPNLLVAIKSSATRQSGKILDTVLSKGQIQPALDSLIQHLVGLTVVQSNRAAIVRLVQSIAKPQAGEYRSWQIASFAELLRELDRQKLSLSELKEQFKGDSQQTFEQLSGLQAFARRMIDDEKAPLDKRLAAIQLLGRDKASEAKDIQILARLILPNNSEQIRTAAITGLGQIESPRMAPALLENWQDYTPNLRAQVLDLLIRREENIYEILNGIENKQLSPLELGAGVREQLAMHKIPTIRERASKLFALPALSERQSLIDELLPQVQTASPRADHGSALFAQQCSICHRLANAGTAVAPDLAGLTDKTPARMLVAILDPNRAVEDRYKSYVAETKSGDEFIGMLVNETGNSVTLVGVTGIRQTILRSDLKSLVCTQRSLMPEGFEQFLNPQDLADIIAYIGTVNLAPKNFPGNHPELIVADQKGEFRLLASNSEIYGDSLTMESQHNNLGFWGSANDHVVWTLDVTKGEKYDVWLVWSCDDGTAGNSFRLQIEEATVIGKVPGTGTWDQYKHDKFGQMELPAGRHKLFFRSEGSIKNYLIDLREVRLVPSSRKTAPQFSSSP
jgi:putative membrane-bound dehydrogenase-like protein